MAAVNSLLPGESPGSVPQVLQAEALHFCSLVHVCFSIPFVGIQNSFYALKALQSVSPLTGDTTKTEELGDGLMKVDKNNKQVAGNPDVCNFNKTYKGGDENNEAWVYFTDNLNKCPVLETR